MKKQILSGNQSPIKKVLKTKEKNIDEIPEDSNSLAIYLKEISKIPLLTPEEELEISKKISEFMTKIKELDQKDPEYQKKYKELNDQLMFYKNKMIRANLRLVVSIAKKFQNRGLNLIDLIDEGNIGLIEAIERFDYTKGFKFSTYGTWWIKQAIVKALADKSKMIRIPVHMLNTIRKCYFAIKNMNIENEKDVPLDQLSEIVGIPVDKLKKISKIPQDTFSLDAPIDNDGAKDFSEFIQDNHKTPSDNLFNIALQDNINEILNCLSTREKQIIELRYGLNLCGVHTLEETGQLLGITRERVRQIQKKALRKMREISIQKELNLYKDN